MAPRDEFLVIHNPALLPFKVHEPAAYTAIGPQPLDRDSTIEDVCDFVVEYMQSDVMVCCAMPWRILRQILNVQQGLVADKHLLIAGMCLHCGDKNVE